MSLKLRNEIFVGANGKPSLFDVDIPESWNGQLIIFIHGYMGFKDWGCWNLVSDYYAQRGYGFLKYNASHNGGTIDNPIDFDDLDSFALNSYTKEIEDFEAILLKARELADDLNKVYVIGHSRGGAIALLQSKNKSIDKICSWAGVCSIFNRFPAGQDLEDWKKSGFYFRQNGRTKQIMPHAFGQYIDFLGNKDRLDIQYYCENSLVPILAIHGDSDESVSIKEGRSIAKWTKTNLIVIKDAQHTFDSSHPWTGNDLPKPLLEVCEKSLYFFETQ